MGQKLKCSHYVPASFNPDSTTSQSLPCVVYAHGNCGCRLEALDAVYCLLPANITVCALDFSGTKFLAQGERLFSFHFECMYKYRSPGLLKERVPVGVFSNR